MDDEASMRVIGSALVKAMGFAVITASDGREALEIYNLHKNEVDLVLMDLNMPVLGGLAAYRLLREISPSIPVVICSGYSVEGILEEIACDERAAVIQKPYKANQLQNILIKLLDKTGLN
ncbi:MAG: response regulator [Desulfuromonadaceae bacterium]